MKRLLWVTVLLLVAATGYAQTPDGETPANEGVCDDLMWATPGLYGLCIAFCEAQDCEPDFSLDNPFENCRPSSERLLRNYDRKKGPGDPDMPCIAPPPFCPCWTEQELADTESPDCTVFVLANPETGVQEPAWTLLLQEGLVGYAAATNDYLLRTEYCPSTGRSCQFSTTDPNIERDLCVSQDEYETCRASIHANAEANGVTCVFP
jgi:hypothetical protein